jgi:hypothetical protein
MRDDEDREGEERRGDGEEAHAGNVNRAVSETVSAL